MKMIFSDDFVTSAHKSKIFCQSISLGSWVCTHRFATGVNQTGRMSWHEIMLSWSSFGQVLHLTSSFTWTSFRL